MKNERRLIIGTAGHIDHGKTVLVKALTGRDTDRLAEEKERGISIDLGFAPFELSDGSQVGIVDVPGHENFVRNMLAGATGVDLALLVVAADDGVMPQTREHLAILDLLGVTRAVVGITKSDLVDEEMLSLVEDEVNELLLETALEGSPVVAVSAVTGAGIEELKAILERESAAVRFKDEAAPARLPIDRVFSLRGIGTVVTGTLWSGSIHGSEQLELLPAGREVRARALEVHDSERQAAYAGERVAVNLPGITRNDVSRGDVLTVPGYLEPTYMLDARVRLLKSSSRPLRRGVRLRFHHGTREVLGRIYPMGAERIEPGSEVPAQLRLESLVVCAPGDRFVLRSYSPVTTIGGGKVVDPHPRKHKVEDPEALEEFDALGEGDYARSISIYLARAGAPVTTQRLVFDSGLPPATVEAALEELKSAGSAVPLGDRGLFIDRGCYADAVESVTAALERFHASRPLADGMEKETLKKQVLASWDGRAADALLDMMSRGESLEIEGKVVRLSGSSKKVTDAQASLMDELVSRIEASPLAPPGLSELSGALGQAKPALAELLAVAEKDGRLIRVSPELFFAPAAVAEAEARLREATGEQGITVSDFKNAVGTSRKYALPLLEYFDRTRVTVRVGDVRKIR